MGKGRSRAVGCPYENGPAPLRITFSNRRTSQSGGTGRHGQQAFQLDSSLKQYARKDLEFVSLFNDAAFQNILK